MTTTRMEVRCCCRPAKLLGTLPVNVEWVRPGGLIDYTSGASTRVRFEVMRWAHRSEVSPELLAAPRTEAIQRFIDEQTRGGLALRHDNITLELLAGIPGFEVAP